MSYKIEIDVNEAIKDFYPALTDSEVDLLAKKISNNWDYSDIYNTLSETIDSYATFSGIDLEGKDGVYEEAK
tara:strand:+ start:45 stop:260 length:216 start_codon:yes stop_codon:yes gene_type:complete